eukprot:123364_1
MDSLNLNDLIRPGVLAVGGAIVSGLLGTLFLKSKFGGGSSIRKSDDGLDEGQNLVRMRRIWYELWKQCGGIWPEDGVFRVEGCSVSSAKLLKLFENSPDVDDSEMKKALNFQPTPKESPKGAQYTKNDYSTAFKRCLAMKPSLLDAGILLRNDLSTEAMISDLAFQMTPTARLTLRLLLSVCVLILKMEDPVLKDQIELREKRSGGVGLTADEERKCRRLSMTVQGISVCITPRLFRDDPLMSNAPYEEIMDRVIKCQHHFSNIVRFARFHPEEMSKLLHFTS